MLIQYPVMESILEWPVFESLTSLRKGQSLAITDSDSTGHNPSPGNPAEQNPENREVEHDFDIEYAIHMFLQNVHSKNPILDSRVLAEAVCRCSANGFDTSRESALVVNFGSKILKADEKLTFIFSFSADYCLCSRTPLVTICTVPKHATCAARYIK